MMDDEFRLDAPVIIVGGGPVGLGLALGLARYRVRSILLERRTDDIGESRAMVIWPRTQEILRDWLAYDAVRAAGIFVQDFRAWDAGANAPIVDLDFRNIDDVVDDPGALVIPQYVTERVLAELAAASEYCDVRKGLEVATLSQDERGVTVTATGPAGPITLRGAYAVGCDGAHGISRHALGLSLEGMTYRSRVVLSDDVIDRTFDDRVLARVDVDSPGLAFAVRFAPNEWRTIASIPAGVTEEVALSPQAHTARLERLFGKGVQAHTKWSSLFSIHRRHAQRFSAGRIALAGDAAHLNSPAGAQGMNAGLHDVANLAWKLAAIFNNIGDGAALFNSYDLERREMVTDTVERFTDRLTRLGIGLPPRIKQFGIHLFSRALRGRGMQRKVCRGIGMLSGRYMKSPIIDTRHPLAGRRIDDLLLPDGKRLNRARNGEAVLIAAGDIQLNGFRSIGVLAPPKRWHLKRAVALIVRPDGCVASVIDAPDPERIAEAWQRAFCGTLPLPLAEL